MHILDHVGQSLGFSIVMNVVWLAFSSVLKHARNALIVTIEKGWVFLGQVLNDMLSFYGMISSDKPPFELIENQSFGSSQTQA